MDDTKVLVATLHERLVSLTDKADAAHRRVDKMELIVREDMREIKKELQYISAHINRSKGWAAAALLLAGVLGSLITKLISDYVMKSA